MICGALQHKGCMPQLDMEALYATLPTRNREVWALIRLNEAMAQAEGHACTQERGALAYQVNSYLPPLASPLDTLGIRLNRGISVHKYMACALIIVNRYDITDVRHCSCVAILALRTDLMCTYLFRLLWRGRRWLPRRPGTWGA